MSISDIMPLIQLLNYLEGLKRLLGSDEFLARFPEFEGLAEKVKARIRSELQKATAGSLDAFP